MSIYTKPGSVSMEELADGTSVAEIEKVFYGKVVDWEQLAQLATEVIYQEQYGLPSHDASGKFLGSIRVRKTDDTPDRSMQYIQTTKVRISEEGANQNTEISFEVNEDAFQAFKILSNGKGMLKHRFIIPIDDVFKWEVDCFPDPQNPGHYYPYVKVDLESHDGAFPRVRFPIELEGELSGSDPSHKERIGQLYEQYFELG